MRRQLPLASAWALSFFLATSSLMVGTAAKAQVRSSLGVSARVMEAGPAWAAARQASQALDTVSAWVRLGWLAARRAQWVDAGSGDLDLPTARVTIQLRWDRQDESGVEDGYGEAAEPAAHGVAVSGTPRSTGSLSSERTVRGPSRVIIYVEHVSN